MSTKEIIIIVVAGVVSFLLAFLLSYKTVTTDNKLAVGKYTLNYGTYKGYAEEYDPDTKKTKKTEMKAELTKDSIKTTMGDKKYVVKGNQLYVDNVSMYEVTGNNKFVLLVGSGVEFKYEK